MPHDAIPRAPAKLRKMLVADLLCGAGGTSKGAENALRSLGLEMDLVAVNHWNVAIESHQANFPTARHFCQDVNVAKPAELVPEGKLDLLLASPTCTFHSRARGGKPINDQGRMDPWAIVHWCTELRVKRLIVENVPEFRDWGPINLITGRPIKRRKGEYFRAWTAALKGTGAKVDYRVLNCADFGDATTRERFFLMARWDGKRLDWPVPTHARIGSTDMFGLTRERWRPAREIIDWTLTGKSIFERKRPLSPKTLARIYAGAVKFKWPEPFLVILRNHMDAQSIDGPIPTVCGSGNHIYVAEPFILNRHGENGATRAHPVDEPMPTADCRGAGYVVEPFLCGNRTNNTPKSVEEPVGGITTTTGGGQFIVEPFVATLAHGNEAHERDPDSRRCRSIDDPLQTIHAGGGKFGIVEPVLVNMKGRSTASGIDAPAPAITAHARHLAVAEAFMLSQASGGSPRSTEEPVPTITTGGAHALIAPYYGSGSGETCGSVEAPLPTATAKGRFGLVVPVTHGAAGGPGPRSVDEPIATMTTAKGGEFALVMPVTHGDDAGRVRSVEDPLPTVTGARRGELAFITGQFGERPGQAPRVRSVDHPAPAITAQGYVPLVEGICKTGSDYANPMRETETGNPAVEQRQYDIRFRMLDPSELAAAMSLDDHVFVGTKTQKTKLIGNAVPARTAAALVTAIMRN